MSRRFRVRVLLPFEYVLEAKDEADAYTQAKRLASEEVPLIPPGIPASLFREGNCGPIL